MDSTRLEMDDDFLYGHVGSDSHSIHQKSIHLESAVDEEETRSCRQIGNDNMSELLGLVNDLREQIRVLGEQLNTKAQENADLNACLVKQTSLGENLSSVLRTSEEKNKQLENSVEKNLLKLESLQTENGVFLDLFNSRQPY